MILKSGLILVAAAALISTSALAGDRGDYPLSEHLDLFRPKYEHRDVRKQLDGNVPTVGITASPEARAAQHRRSMQMLHQWRPDAARQQLLDERCRATRPRCLDI